MYVDLGLMYSNSERTCNTGHCQYNKHGYDFNDYFKHHPYGLTGKGRNTFETEKLSQGYRIDTIGNAILTQKVIKLLRLKET